MALSLTHKNKLFKFFKINTIAFIFFYVLFLIFPDIDIIFSDLFFSNGTFVSEKFTFIKTLRTILKDFMIVIPIISLLVMLGSYKSKKINNLLSKRNKFALIGVILGPIVGCGLIANLYFKDTWGRARPVHVEQFGGTKIFTPAFVKSDQCAKNCSWISGETSAAFSFFVGTIILKNPIFFYFNLFIGILVAFCRVSMGGHFLSDNIFAIIFMFYLAILYRIFFYLLIKKRMF